VDAAAQDLRDLLKPLRAWLDVQAPPASATFVSKLAATFIRWRIRWRMVHKAERGGVVSAFSWRKGMRGDIAGHGCQDVSRSFAGVHGQLGGRAGRLGAGDGNL
jgi:hypothetical protein